MPLFGPTFLPSLAPVLAGLYFLKAGLRPPRTGKAPHCRRCDYALTGLASPNCPECGTAITPPNTVHGRRHRRPRAAAAGALLLILGLAGVTLAVLPANRAIDWYQYRPTSWLIRDLTSADYSIAVRAWNELDRRRTLKPLPPEIEQRIDDAILAQQGRDQPRTPLIGAMMEHIASRADAGQLTPAQFERLCRQALRPRLQQRPVAVAGEQVQFDVRAVGIIPELKRWKTKVTLLAASCGDQRMTGGWGTTVPGLWLRTGVGLPSPGAGRHALRISHRIQILAVDANDDDKSRGPAVGWESELTGFQDVEETPSADNPRLVTTPSPTEMASLIKAEIDWPTGYPYPKAEVQTSRLPENVAFDVIVRYAGRETRVDQWTRDKDDWGGRSIHLTAITGKSPPATIDLIFRSNPRVARTTTEMLQIWGGEVVFHDLPVPTPLPGPSQYNSY